MDSGPPKREGEQRQHYLCLDFGGTKLAAGVVDGKNGQILRAARRPAVRDRGYGGGIDAALELAGGILDEARLEVAALKGVGISFGGPMRSTGGHVVRSMHVDGWQDISLAERVSERLGLPATVENDANAAAIAEWRHGAGRGSMDMLYVQVSTGVGAGIIAGGMLQRGASGGAGELGHVVVRSGGPKCRCGNYGCVESFSAGWALARDACEALEKGDIPLPVGTRTHSVDAEQLIALARAGDTAAATIVTTAFQALGLGVANAVNLLDPELIVVGGGIAHAEDLLFPCLENAVETHVLPHLRPKRVVPGQLGGYAPLVGAALLAHESLAGDGTRMLGQCGALHASWARSVKCASTPGEDTRMPGSSG